MYRTIVAVFALLALLPAWALAAPVPPVTLTAHLEQSVCREGQPVMLALALHNGGTERLIIGYGAFEESSFQITVTDGAGRAVPRTATGERVLTPPTAVSWNPTVEVSAGQTLRYRFNLARLFDLSRTGTYAVSVSRLMGQDEFRLPPLAVNGAPQISILTVSPLKVRLVEDAGTRNGPTVLTRPSGHRTYLYTTNENYTQWTASGSLLRTVSAVSSFQVGQDGSVASTLNVPGLVKDGTGSVAATPDGRFLYVGNENTVSQFRVGAYGALFTLSPPAVPAQKFARRLLMDPKGRFLYALSNWGNTLYAVGHDGRLTVTARMPSQKWSKDGKHNVIPADFGVINPTGTFLYACNGRTMGYRLDARGRVSAVLRTERAVKQKSTDGLTLGEQDTAVALAPSGRFAFMLTSKQIGPPDTATARYEDLVVPMRVRQNGDLNPLPGSETPRDRNGASYGCSALAVDPTGHVLLVLNSQLDFIAPYRIGANGSLTALKTKTLGGRPTNVFFVPGSPLVYVNNLNTGSLLAFRLDGQNGLTPARVDLPTYEVPDAPNVSSVNAPTPPKAGLVAGGLEMSILLAGDVQPAVKPMVLTVVLKNVTSRPIRLGTAGADMASFHLKFTGPDRQSPGVLWGDGEPLAGAVPLSAAGHDLLDAPGSSAVPLVLPPGGERQYRFVLSRLADLTVAGHYTVQVTRILPGGVAVASPVMPFLLDGPFNGQIRGGDYSVQIL